MKPDENSSSQGGTPLLPQRSMADTPSERIYRPPEPVQEAAVQIIRSKIDTLFARQDNPEFNEDTEGQSSSTQLDDINPFQRTHSQHADPQTADWKEYHSAWQNYYQKYYEGYYTHHIQKAKQLLAEQNTAPNEPISAEEAVFDLRQKLRTKVKESATKVKKSRHFKPLVAGIIVILIFLLLQYNRVLISNVLAYVSPGSINPQNIVIDPSADVTVNPEPRLIIPKINVDVPVLYDIGNDYDSQMAAMAKGVAHFAIPGASSHPGQIGNTVLAGHSSNDLFDNGDYKFIFVQLDKLVIGDTIYANYQSKRYTYTVTKKEVVSPTDVAKLVYPTAKPVLTLLTCVPIGTANSRLLVIADQINPDPGQSIAAPVSDDKTGNSTIPGNSPSLLERLFGHRD